MNMEMFDEDFDAFRSGNTGKITTHHAKNVKSPPQAKHYPSCYESHPAVPIGPGHVYGGSCGWPKVTDADIYIGLDSSMNFRNPMRYPWHPAPEQTGPLEVLFRIPDGHPPKDVAEFKAMIGWLAQQLLAGKKIHIGCIGGHGRTGLVLAALKKVVDGTQDAITWVREHYCHKAVESTSQVQFLADEFGITKVPGSRLPPVQVPLHGSGRSHLKTAAEFWSHDEAGQQEIARKARKSVVATTPLAGGKGPPLGTIEATPAASLSSVWGRGAKIVQGPLVKLKKPAKMEPSQEGA
jgi:hypothetical protein